MIRISEPSMTALEAAAVQMCMARNQLSMGQYVEQFEVEFSSYLSAERGLSCSSGTTALHLAMIACQIGPGDEVIVPNLTYIATANAVHYAGARVRLADISPCDWAIDVDSARELINDRTRAIIVVDLYGMLPEKTRELRALCKEHNLHLIEDAAQALGASKVLADGGKFSVGDVGDLATFSFFGNKLITAGEGGFITFRSKEMYERAKKARGQGQGAMRYWHDSVGYNYRMTEIQGAILNCQLSRIDELISKRRKIFMAYDTALENFGYNQQHQHDGLVGPWLKTILLLNEALILARAKDARVIGQRMAKLGVETRPVFYPISRMGVFSERGAFPVSEDVSRRGISLPTHPNMTVDDVNTVVKALYEALLPL